MSLTHILLVEDDEVDTEALRRSLRKTNIANPLRVARDGMEALEIMNGKGEDPLPQPCLVLLDINMPRMNGLELLEKMRQDGKMRDNIVFMLSTSARQQDKGAAYGLNAAGYFLKEDLEALMPVLGGYCKLNQFP